MLITIWWKAGSGKWTISKILAEKLGYEIISIWSLKRKLAEEMGLSISEFNALGEKAENQQEFDLKYEEYQKSLPLESKIILESRLGFLCQPHAFKLFLDVSDEIAAKRILWDQRSTDTFSSDAHALETTKNRNLNDQARYLKLYNINLRDLKHYDCCIDTSNLTPNEVVDQILIAFSQFQEKALKAE